MPTHKIGLRNPYLIYDLCGGAYEANECDQNNPTKQGNNQQKREGKGGPKWGVRSKFEDELASFILEKKFHTKGIGEMLDQHCKEIHEQFSQILTIIRKNKTLELEAPTFAITTRFEARTRDPTFPDSSQPTAIDHTRGTIERGGSESEEPNIF
ncbi:hypothetical protein Tco_1180863 [Tanacetum coccineum]